MGSFIGHVLPGSFFFLFGLQWTIQILRRYLQSFSKNGEIFKCYVSYPPRRGKLRKFDLEGFIMILAAGIGMFVEIIAACILRHKTIGMGNMQHATMYFFFGMVGMLSVLKSSLKDKLPEIESLRYISLALAVLVEGLLFKFHLYGRDDMDQMAHTLLVYICYLTVIVTLLEMKFRDNVLVGLSRAYLYLLQGTWFWQVGFIFYNPIPGAEAWDHTDHHQLMLVVCIMAWHMAALFLAMIGIGIVISFVYRRSGNSLVTELTMEPLGNGYTALLDQNEDFAE